MNEIDQYFGFAKLYDYFLNEDVNYKKYIKILLKYIQERYPDLENAVLADIGGGTGYVTFQIHDLVKNIIMIEPSEAITAPPQRQKRESSRMWCFTNKP